CAGDVSHEAHRIAHDEPASAQLTRLDGHHGDVVDSHGVAPTVDAHDHAVHGVGVRGTVLGARPRALARAHLRVGLVVAAPVAHAVASPGFEPSPAEATSPASIRSHITGKSGMVLEVVPTLRIWIPGTRKPSTAAKVAMRWSW